MNGVQSVRVFVVVLFAAGSLVLAMALLIPAGAVTFVVTVMVGLLLVYLLYDTGFIWYYKWAIERTEEQRPFWPLYFAGISREDLRWEAAEVEAKIRDLELQAAGCQAFHGNVRRILRRKGWDAAIEAVTEACARDSQESRELHGLYFRMLQ